MNRSGSENKIISENGDKVRSVVDEKNTCPHLSENALECRVTKGGLYLPMPAHIEMFCQASLYIQCHQYVKGCELVRETARKYGFILDESRRKYRRVRQRLALLLSTCSDQGQPLAVIDRNACTLDLSLGGLRFETRVEIPVNQKIAFSFGNDFAAPSWQGFGEVRWADSWQEGCTSQAGLIFTDSSTFQAVGKHMGLPGLPMM